MAALLLCGQDAVLSHRTAAVLWGLLPRFVGPVDVTVARSSSRGAEGIQIHTTRSLPRRDATSRKGLRVTAAPRTLLDLAEVADGRELERAVAEAHAQRLVSHERLRSYVGDATGRRGAAPLRALLRDDGGPAYTRSEFERRTLALIHAARLPRPRVNARAAGYEVDFLWPTERLAVEMDSYAFHSSRNAFERDHRKTNDLEDAGYRVRRFTWRQLTEEPHAVVAVIAGALSEPWAGGAGRRRGPRH